MVLIDLRSLPKALREPLEDSRSGWGGLTEDARDEIRKFRDSATRTRRVWGGDAPNCLGSFRATDGEVITGDTPPEMTVTPLLKALAESLTIDGDDRRAVHGYGSVFDVGYVMNDRFGSYIEYMNRHAFSKSLDLEDLRVSFLLSHDGLGLATTTGERMAVGDDDYGLGFVAVLNTQEVDAGSFVQKLESGSTSSDTSIGGSIRAYQWNSDYTEIELFDWWLSRGEISAVHAGANPAGWVALRSSTSQEDVELAAMNTTRSLVAKSLLVG